MLDHVGIRVRDFAQAKAFYAATLAPLGYRIIMEFGEQAAGLGGSDGKPDFWIGPGTANGPIHLAFVAADRRSVDAFYQAAIKAGAKDNGKPGVRAEYHPTYYGAFVLDADGNNVEAVCHAPE
jgi:catechol 2,3-dioxygenase-like lactoylglutathione lyase family enzyme